MINELEYGRIANIHSYLTTETPAPEQLVMAEEEESKESQEVRREQFEANLSHQMPIVKVEEPGSPLKVSYDVGTGAKQSNDKIAMPGSTLTSTVDEKLSESSSPKAIQDESETANDHVHVLTSSLL